MVHGCGRSPPRNRGDSRDREAANTGDPKVRRVTKTNEPKNGDLQAGATSDTLGRKTYLDLQQSLLNGELLPGTRLTLRGLAETLRISTQPIREAVNRLAAEGAVDTARGRAILVPRRTREELDDLHSMRVMLEADAASRFALRAESAEIEVMAKITAALRASYTAADTVGIVTHMQRFGLAMAQGSRSEVLTSAIFSVRIRLAPHIAEAVAAPMPFDPDFLQFTVHINDQIVMALRDHDAVLAHDLRRADLLTMQRVLYERLGLPRKR
jgi:GntR family transcriptional regulator, colanic acid and biofilm gene transcriptional regulator